MTNAEFFKQYCKLKDYDEDNLTDEQINEICFVRAAGIQFANIAPDDIVLFKRACELTYKHLKKKGYKFNEPEGN
jgi:hypothetical protein